MIVLLECGTVVYTESSADVGQIVSGMYCDENGNLCTKTGRIVEILEA